MGRDSLDDKWHQPWRHSNPMYDCDWWVRFDAKAWEECLLRLKEREDAKT